MSKLRSVTLGGKEYPLGDFTIDQVSRIAVLLKSIEGVALLETVPQATSRNTVVFIGLQSGGYAEKFEKFLEIKGLKLGELSKAQLEIGRAIGYYAEADAAPGEALGEALPLAS